ncbi:hypothetical protein BXZ70DRAFT_1009082 [Cristinia sonorae]|uniref:Uncharacterized protein n=1 Tax=Cristinia sonorae TaxID=1940300 RepID=A0A8K0ULA2_9AGAR|nr:hypothetical protein BXZ70DRAFT_1009082 [Cristinia sonorae]
MSRVVICGAGFLGSHIAKALATAKDSPNMSAAAAAPISRSADLPFTASLLKCYRLVMNRLVAQPLRIMNTLDDDKAQENAGYSSSVPTVCSQRDWLENLMKRRCSLPAIRDFQLQHGLDLIHGKDVFLVIAPGGGKTLVSLAPLLYAQEMRESGIALITEPSKFLTEQQSAVFNVGVGGVEYHGVQISSRAPDQIHHSIKDSLPAVAQKQLLPPKAVDITNASTLASAFQDADVVVSLVGILHGSPADFERIQWRGAENVAKAAQSAGAKLIHISAIGADPKSDVPYERTKGQGEEAVWKACPTATVIRPSLVFGPEDDFFNRFAKLSRVLPFMPVFGGGTTRFQPVYVGDIARAVEILSRRDAKIRRETDGKFMEAGGPDVLTYREIMQLVLRYTNRWRPVVSMPFAVGILQASILERLPHSLFTLTRDQVRQLEKDNVVNAAAELDRNRYIPLRELIGRYSDTPLASVHEILPTYL